MAKGGPDLRAFFFSLVSPSLPCSCKTRCEPACAATVVREIKIFAVGGPLAYGEAGMCIKGDALEAWVLVSYVNWLPSWWRCPVSNQGQSGGSGVFAGSGVCLG